MNHNAVLLIAAGCILSSASALMAGENQGKTTTELGGMVVTATKTEKSKEEAPGAIQVITSQQIAEMNATTVAEALETATGMIVTTASGRVNCPSIRGTRSNHSLVLVDGRRLVSGFGDRVDSNQIPVTMVQRIEIVRGPSSALYGSEAIGGVVNIITKKPVQAWQGEVTGQTGINKDGEGDSSLASAYGNGFYDKVSFSAGGEFRNKNKWNRTIDDEADDGDDTDMNSGAGRFAIDIAPRHQLSGGVDYSDRDMEGYRLMEGLQRNRDTEDERKSYFLQYDGKIGETSQVMFMANRSEAIADVEITPAVISTEAGKKENTLNQVEGRFSSLFFDRHLITSGLEFLQENREGYTESDLDVDNLSLFFQDDYQVTDPLILVAGFRLDEHSEFGSEWTPKLAFIYAFADNLRVKGAYGLGFRAPSITELYVTSWKKRGKEIYQPNADLDPEESESYEVGLEGEYKIFQGSMTFFRNEIDNLIDVVFVNSQGTGSAKKDYYQYENIADAITQGVELEGGMKLPLGFSLATTMTWMNTENKETGTDLEGQPDFKGEMKIGYDYPAMRLHANIRTVYYGDRYYSAGDEDGYYLTHLYFSKGVNERLKLFAGVKNIFDDANDDPAFYYAGINLKF